VVHCAYCGVTEFVGQGCHDDSFWISYSWWRLNFGF
jgi:hypothetical protein